MKPHLSIRLLACALFVSWLAGAALGLAGPGHDHGPAPGESGMVTGPFTLSEQAVQNLGLKTVTAEIKELAPTLDLPALLTLPPSQHAAVSAKFTGKVHDLFVKLGDLVEKGQPLATLDPDMIGNPPVTLRAPLSGVVSRQNLILGQAFDPQTVLMEIADPSTLLAKAITYESEELGDIRPGQPAAVQVDMLPDQVFEGTVVQVSPGIRPSDRTFETYVEIKNPKGELLPNSQATVSIFLGKPATVVAIPKRALVGDQENRSVFVRDDAVFERREVVVGLRSGDQVEILEGVFPGEEVVTQGNYQLQFASGQAAEDGHGHGHNHGHGHSHSEDDEKPAGPSSDWTPYLIGAVVFLALLILLRFGSRTSRSPQNH